MANKRGINDDHDELPPDERLISLLGLLADQEIPTGPTPTLLEIQDWHLGKLDQKRAAEVKMHVARDPACYQMWSDLLAAEKEPTLTPDQPQSVLSVIANKCKQSWRKPDPSWLGGGLVTAAVVSIIAVVLMPGQEIWSPIDDPIVAPLDYDWPYASMSSTRGGKLSYRMKIAVQTGIRKGIEITTQGQQGWNEAINSLPPEALSCEKETNKQVCEQETKLLQKVGVHAGVFYLACLEYEKGQQNYFDSESWNKQITAWKKIADEIEILKIKPLLEKIQKTGTSKDRSQQCEAIRDVIYLSF